MAKLKELLAKIKRPGDATAADVNAQVDKWRRARADAVQGLEALAAKRRELLLAGDDLGLDGLDADETKHLRTVELADLLLPGLNVQLASLRNSGRHSAIGRHRKQIRAAFDELEPALSAAIAANEKTRAAYEAAIAELGADHARSAIGECPIFSTPGFNTDTFQHWRAFHHGLFEKLPAPNSSYKVRLTRPYPPFDTGGVIDLPADAAWPLVKSSSAEWADPKHVPPPPPGTVGKPYTGEIIPHGDFSRRIALYQTPAPSERKPAPKIAPPAPAARAEPKPRPPRPPLPDIPPAGMVRMRVLRAGYPDGEGVALLPGDLVDVAEHAAKAAAHNSAVEYLTPGGEK